MIVISRQLCNVSEEYGGSALAGTQTGGADISVPTAGGIKNITALYVPTPRLLRGMGGMQGKTLAREVLRRAPKVITSLA